MTSPSTTPSPSISPAAHLRRITLHLARTKEHPQGSIRHGYDFVAPLDDEGRIALEAWRAQRNACVVHRFWGNEPRQRGILVHHAGGVGGASWAFDYDRASTSDDETGYRFGDHRFVPGEYVSLRDAEGDMHTFRVADVTPA